MDSLLAAADELGCAPLEVLERAPERLATRGRRALESLAGDLAEVVDAIDGGPVAVVDAVLGVDGLVEAATTRDGRDNPEQRRENLRELAASARSFLEGSSMSWPLAQLAEMSGPERCEAFMSNAALLSGGEQDERTECVQLMTAHACKGREFDVVYVAGVEDGFFPHSSAGPDEVDEEIRLLFVAASRARKRLTLTRAETRFRFRDTEWRDPSPFLGACEELVVTQHRGRGVSQRRPSRPGLRDGRRVNAVPSSSKSWSGPALHPPKPAPGPRVDPAEIAQGSQVVHDTYGPGEVLSCDGEIAQVRFASGIRVLMLAAAPMRLG